MNSTFPAALGRRLTLVRDRADLSLRAFSRVLRERTGHAVSHSTVREHEVRGSAPAGYVRAVCVAFAVDPAWLLDVADREGGSDALVEDALQGIEAILRELVDGMVDDAGRGADARGVDDAGREG